MSFSIIIPSRNAINLVACIGAIRSAGETARIIIVDDGVDCGPADLPVGSWPFQVVAGIKPFIFARNINLGIKAAGVDDVILLNDDALLETERGFTRMSIMAERWSSEFGLIAASCDSTGNPNQSRRPYGEATSPVYKDMHYDGWLRNEPRMACFVCVYIPRTTIDKVGLLDERFVGYGLDDDDYSLRVRNAGMKIGIFDGCYVNHGSLTSSFRGRPQAGGDFTANMRRFIAKWGVDNWGKTREKSQFAHLFPEAK